MTVDKGADGNHYHQYLIVKETLNVKYPSITTNSNN